VRTDEFDYHLPTGLIAQSPVEPRDSCRLLVLDRTSDQIDHRRFSDLPDYLGRGDLLVVNETRVLPARLIGVKDETGGAIEILLLRERYDHVWECLAKPGRKLQPGTRVILGDGAMTALVLDVLDDRGGRLVQFHPVEGRFIDIVHDIGEVPLPPYVTRKLEDAEEYQTIFARDERSAAAPTAGLHFTPELVERVKEAGARIAAIELDVGLDTFRPVAEEDPELHVMHSEHFRVPPYVAEEVNDTRARGGRVIAVGTTSVRALESAWDDDVDGVAKADGATRLFILPGYRFRVVDSMITNFHVPRSTLMMMVSAFAGRDATMRAYRTAIEERYRFLSFGDAMLIL
jgi:S-adenosylmethionine:tRNA ribosyltransferase-isomerase